MVKGAWRKSLNFALWAVVAIGCYADLIKRALRYRESMFIEIVGVLTVTWASNTTTVGFPIQIVLCCMLLLII